MSSAANRATSLADVQRRLAALSERQRARHELQASRRRARARRRRERARGWLPCSRLGLEMLLAALRSFRPTPARARLARRARLALRRIDRGIA